MVFGWAGMLILRLVIEVADRFGFFERIAVFGSSLSHAHEADRILASDKVSREVYRGRTGGRNR
jgi:hypothetical protein